MRFDTKFPNALKMTRILSPFAAFSPKTFVKKRVAAVCSAAFISSLGTVVGSVTIPMLEKNHLLTSSKVSDVAEGVHHCNNKQRHWSAFLYCTDGILREISLMVFSISFKFTLTSFIMLNAFAYPS